MYDNLTIKHVFIIKGIDRFPLLFFSYLKNHIDLSKILIVYYGEFKHYSLLKNYGIGDINVISINEIFQFDFSIIKTITLFSLRIEYYDFVKFIHKNFMYDVELNMMLTDDETHRLDIEYSSLEGITDERKLFILNFVDNFFNLKKPWGQILEKVLKKSIKINNKLPLISILPLEQQDELLKNRNKKSKKSNVIKVLIGPKSDSYPYIFLIKLIISLIFSKSNNEIKEILIGYWRPKKKEGIIIYLWKFKVIDRILILLNRINNFFGRKEIKIVEIRQMKPDDYFKMLTNFDILISRKRGGGSAIREFIKSGGCVLFKSGSYNQIVYQQNVLHDIPSFSRDSEIIKYIYNLNIYNNKYKRVREIISNLEIKSIKYYTNYFS